MDYIFHCSYGETADGFHEVAMGDLFSLMVKKNAFRLGFIFSSKTNVVNSDVLIHRDITKVNSDLPTNKTYSDLPTNKNV